MASFTMLRLRSTDVALVEQQLRAKVSKLPSLFLDAPVLVDLGGLGDGASSLALDDLVRALRACKLVPVADIQQIAIRASAQRQRIRALSGMHRQDESAD